MGASRAERSATAQRAFAAAAAAVARHAPDARVAKLLGEVAEMYTQVCLRYLLVCSAGDHGLNWGVAVSSFTRLLVLFAPDWSLSCICSLGTAMHGCWRACCARRSPAALATPLQSTPPR